ncbi:MAG: STAS domain-containing protein [Candidatus Krumholzibacteria bacterium]
MKVEQREHNGIVILELEGPLFSRSYKVQHDERKELQDLFQSLQLGRTTRVIVSLTKVNYVNSSGWGSLIGAYKRLGSAGGELLVVHGGGKFEEVIHLLKLDQVWKTFVTVDEALAHFAAAESAE